MEKDKELCISFIILFLYWNRWSNNISYKSISDKPNLLLVLEKKTHKEFCLWEQEK